MKKELSSHSFIFQLTTNNILVYQSKLVTPRCFDSETTFSFFRDRVAVLLCIWHSSLWVHSYSLHKQEIVLKCLLLFKQNLSNNLSPKWPLQSLVYLAEDNLHSINFKSICTEEGMIIQKEIKPRKAQVSV